MCVSLYIFLLSRSYHSFFFPVKQNYTVILIIATHSGSAEFVAVNVTLLYFVLCAFICHNYYDFPADFMMRTIVGCVIVEGSRTRVA